MALNRTQLVEEVKSLVGRPTDTVLITDTRVSRWLNEGQLDIAEKVPGINALTFKNTGTFITVQDQLEYDLGDLTFGDNTTDTKLNHLFGIYYLDGNESLLLKFYPNNEFDVIMDPSSTDYGTDRPLRWTRRGDKIEVFPLTSAGFAGKTLRVDGDYYPGDVSTVDGSVSDILRSDQGLLYYAIAEAWGAIGEEQKFAVYRQKYDLWMTEYKEQNDYMFEWEGNVYDGVYEYY